MRPFSFNFTSGGAAPLQGCEEEQRLPSAHRRFDRATYVWKSGALYKQRPERLSDITDGSKFRNSFKLCGLSNDPKELRMLTSKSYTVWTLAMGIRCVPYLL